MRHMPRRHLPTHFHQMGVSRISERFHMYPKSFLSRKIQPIGIFVTLLPMALISPLKGETAPRIAQITPPQFLANDNLALDLDSDGDMDLLMKGRPGQNTFWIENLGGRSFSEPKILRYDQSAEQSWIEDLNGDGLMDAFQKNRIADDNEARALTASLSEQSLKETSRVDLGRLPGEFQVLELGGDTRAEILRLETHESGDDLLTIANLSEGGSLGLWPGPYNIPASTSLDCSKAVDVDGDGDLDLHLGAWILERTGPQTFSEVLRAAPKPAYHSEEDTEAKWADFDGDGLMDVFTTSDNTLKWAKNSGDFNFTEQSAVTVEGELLSVLNIAESQAVIIYYQIITNGSTNEWHLKKMLISGQVISDDLLESGEWPVAIFYAIPSLVWDFDNDGWMDVFRLAHVQPNALPPNSTRLWPTMNWGNVTDFDALLPIVEAPLCENASSSLADFDDDGNVDLVIGPDVLGRFTLMRGDGRGAFLVERPLVELLPAEFEEIGVQIESVQSGDIDADGVPDLMVKLRRISSLGSPQHLSYFARNTGHGTFSIPEFPVGSFDFFTSSSNSRTLYDWDGDGDLDAVGGAWQKNENGVLSQSSTPLLSSATVIDPLGNPLTLDSYSVGDLDGDGRSDIISNVFHVTPKPPGLSLLGFEIESSTLAIGFSDAFGVIEEVSVASIKTVERDALGNVLQAGKTAIIDVNMDGHNDLLFSCFTTQDALGNWHSSSYWKRNPGNGSRLVENWVTLPLSTDIAGRNVGDFNGDNIADYSNGTAFLTPTLSGPLISPEYDFVAASFLTKPDVLHVVDLDGDRDEDLIVKYNGQLHVARNLIVDERSGVATRMRAAGVLGQLSNPDEDADGDGRSNVIEFFQGTDPLVLDAADPDRSQPSLAVSGSDLTIHYESREDAGELDFVYQLEFSENLKDWIPMAEQGATHQSLSNGWQKTILPQELIHPRAFYRVRMRHEVPSDK